MVSSRKLEYLQAIGVDVYVRRPLTGEAVALAYGDAPSQVSAASSPASTPTSGPQSGEDLSLANLPPSQLATLPPSHLANLPPSQSAPSVVSQVPPAATVAVPVPSLPSARPSAPLSADEETHWESLKAEVLGCRKCTLHATRTQGVFGVGNRRADWLVIGEAPGAEEDRRGEPFVGRAGQLLNAMLKAIGLDREQVFIANVLKSRPPNNRDPKPEEVAACLPYLMRQIALLQPRLMLAVGRIAAQNLLATDMALGRLRGQVHTFGELNTPLIVTYHPAYLLRSPADKRKAWEDLKFARSTFQRLASQDT
jgi:DNA polymerase